MAHHADVLEVEPSLQPGVGLIPELGLVQDESDILRSGRDFRRIMDHRVQVLHQLKALGHLFAITADVLHAQDDVAMRGEMSGLGEMRVEIAARAM